MADQADVENALAAIVANALYPNGVSAPSVAGAICRVYRGFPASPSLDADLAAGATHVSITAGVEVKNVTRYARRWLSVAPVSAVLNVAISHNSAAFSGHCAAGQLAGVIANTTPFAYAVQANDSPATVASNMAALLRTGGWLVDYAGASITVPAAAQFSARVVAGAGALQEVKRQVQDFKISLWCPNPGTRDAVASLLDQALAELIFIPLADGSFARLIFAASLAEDNVADANLYRRDLTYRAEYPTTVAQFTPAMLFGTATVSIGSSVVETIPS